MSNNTKLATAPQTATNYILKATSTTLGNSLAYDDGSGVAIGDTTASGYKFKVNGTGNFTGALSGTSATFSGLTLSSASTPLLQIVDTTNSKSLLFGADDNNTFIRSSSSTPIFLQVNGGDTAMTLASNSNVGIGTSSPSAKLDVSGQDIYLTGYTDNRIRFSNYGFTGNSMGAAIGYIYGVANTQEQGNLAFYTNPNFNSTGSLTERMRITSGGGVAIGTTSAGGTYKLRVINSSAVQGDAIFASDNNVYNSILVYAAGADGYNGAGTIAIFGRNTSTSRSINAGGTINASGADYAEYMTKAIEDNIAKGDIVGVDENGLLTNIFADAKSFVVKSTDPSYVGGDTWGNIDDIGKLPLEPTEQEKAEHQAKLEAARQKVDRIAFSGQVPCNVYGAKVGDYIIPIELDGKIAGQAVTNPTFEQYQLSVGKVWKIMEDGRAWIAVKIG